MTVHMIEISSHFPDGVSLQQIQNIVDNWIENHSEWGEDTVEHTVEKKYLNISSESPEVYLSGDFRFEISDSKNELLNDIESSLQGNVAWYRIGYHECFADTDIGDCSSTTEREYNSQSIPNGVPDNQ